MAVHQFGRKTNIVRHDGPHAFLVEPVGADTAQDGANAAAGEKGAPERKVLVHSQAPRDAYSKTAFGYRTAYAIRPLCCRIAFGCKMEEQSVFLVEQVYPLVCPLRAIGIDAFTVVAGEIGLSVGKRIAADLAFILASRAHFVPLLKMIGFYQFVQFHCLTLCGKAFFSFF